MKMENITNIISGLTAAISTFFAWMAVKESKVSNNFNAVNVCVTMDSEIGELKNEAIEKNDGEIFEKACKKMIWLQWLQYCYCKEKVLPKKVLVKWNSFNYKNFYQRTIAGKSFNGVWNDLRITKSYDSEVEFCKYMDYIINGEGIKAEKLL